MPIATANRITIAYETFGRRHDRALVLIMGLASQMIEWPDRFCQMLAGAGHWVIRFDNRDSGLSAKLDGLGLPKVHGLMAGSAAGLPAPYSLADMAADTLGLMDALELEKAHVCGLSMGGMVAQVLALQAPQRLAGLVSMESSTGESDLPPPRARAAATLFSGPPAHRAAYLDHVVRVYREFAGGSPLYDAQLQRELAARAFDRSFYPMGFARQMAAIATAAGRRRALGRLELPALVIHGDCDPLVPLRHAEDTAAAIHGARLEVLSGLGHGMAYPRLWPSMVAAISQLTGATP